VLNFDDSQDLEQKLLALIDEWNQRDSEAHCDNPPL